MGAAQSLQVTFSMAPLASNRSSSCSMADLIAKGTGRGLKNFGRASGRTCKLA